MFKDASDEAMEQNHELRDLPDEIVDSDGCDELPDEVGLSDGAVETDELLQEKQGDSHQDVKQMGDGEIPAKFDDNGNEYREGNSLIPNNRFEIHGYTYITDALGRVISAFGPLRIRDSDYARNMEDVKKIEGQEYKTGDDRGHIIGHQFGGSDKLENLIPMDATLNRGDYAKLENNLADAVKDGAVVTVKVEIVYDGDSTRPSEFKVTYTIDGDKTVEVFKNESEVKS